MSKDKSMEMIVCPGCGDAVNVIDLTAQAYDTDYCCPECSTEFNEEDAGRETPNED